MAAPDEHLFDHTFLTGQIPTLTTDRWRAAREACPDAPAERDQLANHLADTLTHQLHAAGHALNTALLVLQNPDLMTPDIAANKIRLALATLDTALNDLTAAVRDHHVRPG